MPIKILALKEIETADLDKFRNLSEFMTFLDKVKQSIDRDDEVLHKYQTMLSNVKVKVLAVKNPGTFTIDMSDEPVVEKPKVQFQKPEYKAMTPHIDLINRMVERLEFLSNLEAQLEFEFKDDKMHSKAVAALRALKKDVTTKLNAAHTAIGKFSAKQEPKQFKTLANKVIEELKTRISSSYKTIAEKTLVNFEESVIEFYRYINLKGFTNDAGYEFDSFYVILACVVDAGANLTYYAAISPTLVAPNNIRLTHSFTTFKQALETIDDLFELEHFNGLLADHPLIVTKEHVGKDGKEKLRNKDNIDRVEFGEHAIVVLLKKGVKDADHSIQAQIVADFKGISGKIRAGQVRAKRVVIKGQVAIKIVFAPTTKDSVDKVKLTQHQVHQLKDNIGLSDEQVKRINSML